MIGGGGQVFNATLDAVERWIPKKRYRHEKRFQKDLHEYLTDQLASGGGGGMALDMGPEYHVQRERGRSKCDIVVNDVVGIEMKRALSGGQMKKLRGQIESHLDVYNYVIICACGINDVGGWNELRQKYSGGQMGMGLGMDGGTVEFVHKKEENMGQSRGLGRDDGGGLFGGGGFL